MKGHGADGVAGGSTWTVSSATGSKISRSDVGRYKSRGRVRKAILGDSGGVKSGIPGEGP
jgi:hypothetical protein